MTGSAWRLGGLGLALLMGRASLLGLTMPLALGLYAAVRYQRPRSSPLVGLGLLAGQLSLGAYWTALRLVLAMLGVAASAGWLDRPRLGGWRRAGAAAGLTGAAALFTRVIGLVWSGLSPYELAIGAAEAMLAAVVALVLDRGLAGLLHGGRLDPGRAEQGLALVLVVGGGLAGLGGWSVFGLELALVGGAAVVMLLGRAGGGAYGALAGVAAGLVVGMSNPAVPPAQVGVWAVAGLLAGLGGDLGTWGAVAGFGLGMACMAALVPEPSYLGRAAAQTAVAGAVVALVPVRAMERARLWCRGPDAEMEGAHLSSALRLLAASRLGVIAGVFAELSQAFAEPAATASLAPAAPEASEARRLLARQLAGVSGITADLAQRMALGDIPSSLLRAYEVEAAVSGAGRPVRQAVLAPAEHGFEVHVQCQEPATAGCQWCLIHAAGAVRPVVGRHLHLARRHCAPPGEGCYFVLATEPRLELEVGISRQAQRRELVSGDSVASRRVGGHRQLLLLCDGMGKGLAAARESATAARMVEAMLEAGFGLDTTLDTINAALLLRSSREAFTTIDLALVDLSDGRLDLVKVGACPSYLCRDGQLRTLESNSPPAGILDRVRAAGVRATLRPGDLLVMVSDGVFAGQPGPRRRGDWLARAVQRHDGKGPPQELADHLLALAASRQRHGPADDMTVLVASLRRRNPNG